MRYLLIIAYDGTGFSGWQRQKNALSVQEVLEKALEEGLGKPCRVTASGPYRRWRTRRGATLPF